MKTYSEEFKAQIMAQMLPPTNRGIPELARETGIPKDTLYTWRGKQRMAVATLGAKSLAVEGFTSADKFHLVVESAALNAQEVGEFCRRRGLYPPEQLAGWREICLVANTPPARREEPAECRALRRRNSELESELRRKEKALAEAATLLVLQKSPGAFGGARGRKLDLGERQTVMALIREAGAAGARLEAACAVLDVSPRTGQRWQAEGGVKVDGRHAAAQARTPANALSPAERQRLLLVANSPEFAGQPPSQIVPRLADRGEYLASEATFYQVLRAADHRAHRGKAKAPSHHRPRAWVATGPNQVWSWDITYLVCAVAGLFFYLYLILDVFSRKIVGWEIHTEQTSDHAAVLFRKARLREGVAADTLVLHSDNGSPMKGATLLVTLQRLGVVPSFGRPAVSNDNPYSEALFKTCKYRPGFPEQPFASLEQARTWVAGFVRCYNDEHRHSGICFVTPGQRHRGDDVGVLEQRKAIYKAARQAHPERWSGGTLRNWERPSSVSLNPSKPAPQKAQEESQNTD